MIVQKLIEDITAEAEEQKDVLTLIKESLIPQGVRIPEPDVVFGINGVSVFTKKSISTLIGRAKGGKTSVTAWIVAQSIKNETKVLWIDTEQGLYYGSRTQYWVLNIANLKVSSFLQFYDLKIFPPNQRLEMIEIIIKEFAPDLVIIDGIKDLVFDINNPEEATRRTGDLMRWADIYDCHILSILHQNKGNEHSRGHLGTEMTNKSETVIRVEKNEDKLVICTPEYTRSKEFDIFAFDRNEHGIPFIVDGYAGKITTNLSSSKKGIDPTDIAYNSVHPEIVNKIFSKEQFLKYNDLLSNIIYYFKLNGVDMGQSKARDFITHYLMIGIIWKNPHIKGYAKYEKNPLFDPMGLVVAGSRINTHPDTEPPF